MTHPPASDPQAKAMPAVTLKAWRAGSDNPRLEAYPIDLPEGIESVEEAAQLACFHRGETIFVLRSDAAERPERRNVLCIYQVKRKASPARRWSNAKGGWETAPAEYPALIGIVCVREFDPVEPWRWSPGADVVGLDRTLIEQRA